MLLASREEEQLDEIDREQLAEREWHDGDNHGGCPIQDAERRMGA